MMKKLVPGLLAAGLLAIAPAPGHADTYAPHAVDQDFAGSQGGWSQTSTYAGLCLQNLTCPEVVNDWAAGGADGNGYIRTRFGSSAATEAGTSVGVWESPAFAYHGDGGQVPDDLTFDMSIRPQVTPLVGSSAFDDSSFRVDLVDQGTGTAVSVVPPTGLTSDTGWTTLPSVPVNPGLLRLGSSYTIRITTTYHASLAVVGAGEVGYDDVRLTGASDPAAPVVGPNGGSGITDIKQLRTLTKHYILPQTATVSGRLLEVTLRCPAVAGPKPCQIQLQGLQAGKFSTPATARKVVRRLKAGKERTVRIRIKPPYVATYGKANKIWTKAIVRVGKVRVTVHKRIKLT